MGVTLWDWAVRAYARPGAKAACLALQDDFGLSVPLLLWAAWLAEARRGVGVQVLTQAAALARRAEADIIGPLREARRAIPQQGPVREAAKAAELAAERGLLEQLEALCAEAGSATYDLTTALAAAADAWGATLPPGVLIPLARALTSTVAI